MIETLQQVFAISFDRFLEREANNIISGVSERNLCARFAPLLEYEAHVKGFGDYFADVEYNRKQGGQVKTIRLGAMLIIPITCDLILHSRGHIPAADNLIAVEMKRTEHPETAKHNDRVRLKTLTMMPSDGVWSVDGKTLPEHVCGYKLAYYVELNRGRRTFRIEEYQLGERTNASRQKF